MKTDKEIIAKFYKKFSNVVEPHPEILGFAKNLSVDIADFILNALKNQREEFKRTLNSGRGMYLIGRLDQKEELVREIEGIETAHRWKTGYPKLVDQGYYEALDDILNLLKK